MTPMPYSPLHIANGFLERSFGASIPIDHMKMQKLLYFSHGYYLALTEGDPLLSEQFQAWKFGPVLPSVYQRLKRFGARPITEYAEVYDPVFRSEVPAAAPENDPAFVKVREFVWERYGSRESIALSSLTHREGGAWDKTIKGHPGIQGPQISNDDIQEEFSAFIRRPEPAVVA
jgi:uncharacterized phage-associated protein